MECKCDTRFVLSLFIYAVHMFRHAVISASARQTLNLSPEDVFLAQGTLRPDLIESASVEVSSKADAIKTHHNDTELVRALRALVCHLLVCWRASGVRW